MATPSVTVITCYYKVKSKHSFEEYSRWITNLLYAVRSANIIIFTTVGLDLEKKYLRDMCNDSLMLLLDFLHNKYQSKIYSLSVLGVFSVLRRSSIFVT